MKEDKYAITKYFRNFGLAGLVCLAYTGARHIFGAPQMDEHFQLKSLSDLLIVADYAVGGFGLMMLMASAIWTPFCYIIERIRETEIPINDYHLLQKLRIPQFFEEMG